MYALLLSDKDAKSPLSEDLRSRMKAVLEEKGYEVEAIELGAANVVPCTGCLLCHTKTHGVCVDTDALSPINARIGELDLICFLGPIVFGQFGSTIKSALDKVQHFRMRSRFEIAVGYGEDVHDDEAATFIDIVRKHSGAANVVHPKFTSRSEVYTSRSLRDNGTVCEQLQRSL